MKLAPIILFVYNRPWHTLQTLKHLKNNHLVNDSKLYIYSDGVKNVNDNNEVNNIHKVRDLISEINWCKEKIIIERKNNYGLAKSIINGIDEVLQEHERVIVLEDDIITSKYFLKFMNDALELYKNEEKVMHISGYMFPVKKNLPNTFFFNTATCWGWGTWRTKWRKLHLNSLEIIKYLTSNDLVKRFNLEGFYNYYDQLLANHEKRIETWAIFWYATIFMKRGYALHPYPSLTTNIGHDSSGMNSQNSIYFNWDNLAEEIVVKKIPLEENKKAVRAVQKFYRNQRKRSLLINLKELLYKYLSNDAICYLKSFTSKKLKNEYREINRINHLPRYTKFETSLLGNKTIGIDPKSFIFTYREIYLNKIYQFKLTRSTPYIIDCGANIGLSVIFFKNEYPHSVVLAFEPDEYIFKILQNNIINHNLNKIELKQVALWKNEGKMLFENEGADGGKIQESFGGNKIKTETLSKYLDKQVDFLKIDIEGVEYEVLKECSDKLSNVENLFIEYHSFENKSQNLHQILEILVNNNFRYYLSVPGVTSINPLVRPQKYAGMDMQINIHAFNIGK